MAYGVTHFFANGTQAQYDASVKAVHPSHDKLPKGQLFHAAGPANGGWQIVAIHESKASWEDFRDKVLMPKLGAGVPGGFAGPPVETTFEVYKQQLG